jgi:hypothetical protein
MTRRAQNPAWFCRAALVAALVAGGLFFLRPRPSMTPAACPQTSVALPRSPIPVGVQGEKLAPTIGGDNRLPRLVAKKRSYTQQSTVAVCSDAVFKGEIAGVESPIGISLAGAQARLATGSAVEETEPEDPGTPTSSGAVARETEALRKKVQSGDARSVAEALGLVLTVRTSDPALGQYLAAFRDVRSPAVAEWLIGFLARTEDEEFRSRAKRMLASLKGPEAVEILFKVIAEARTEREVTDCVAAILEAPSDPSRTPALQHVLEIGESQDLRVVAAYGLAGVGNDEACSVLLEGISLGGPEADLYLGALATVQSSYGQERLIAAAIDSSLPSATRGAAVRALAMKSGPTVRTALENVAGGVIDQALREEIARALVAPVRTENAPRQIATEEECEQGELWL